MIQSDGCLVLDPDTAGHVEHAGHAGHGDHVEHGQGQLQKGAKMGRKRRTGDVDAKPGDPGFPDPTVVIPKPEIKQLKPGQKREFAFNYNVPLELLPWIEATRRRYGFSSLSDAVLFYLAKGGGFEFTPIAGRRGFAAMTKKKIKAAIARRVEIVNERIRKEEEAGER